MTSATNTQSSTPRATVEEIVDSVPRVPEVSEEDIEQSARWSLAVARDFTRSRIEFGWFIVVDEGTHEVIELAALKALDSRSALKELKRLITKRGPVDSISVQEHDFVRAGALVAHCNALGIRGSILPGDAGVESGRYIDRFMLRFRLEFVGKEVYRSLSKAKDMAVEYIDFCNHTRPDASLGGMAPARYQGFSG